MLAASVFILLSRAASVVEDIRETLDSGDPEAQSAPKASRPNASHDRAGEILWTKHAFMYRLAICTVTTRPRQCFNPI